MNVSLTPKLERFIQKRVASGRYQSASEVVREALRLLEERAKMRDVQIQALRQDIQLGIDQANRGELEDGERVFERLRTKRGGSSGHQP